MVMMARPDLEMARVSEGQTLLDMFKQRFDFTANGTLRVSKHGFWEERDPDDSKRASEGITTWIECQTEP